MEIDNLMRLNQKGIVCMIGVILIAGCGLSSRPALPDRPAVMQAEPDPEIQTPIVPVLPLSESIETPPMPDLSVPQSNSTVQSPGPTESPATSLQSVPGNQLNQTPALIPNQPDSQLPAKIADSLKTAESSSPPESTKPKDATPAQKEPTSPPREKTPEPLKPESPPSQPVQPPSHPNETAASQAIPSELTELEEAARKAEEELIAKLPPFYARYAELLKLYVDDNGNVDYGILRRKRGDLLEATRMLDELDPQQVLFWTPEEKIALWLNAHNLFTIKLIVDNYPIKSSVWGMWYPPNSIMQISGARDKTYFKMMGLEYTLREIERDILLKRFEDPRICFALSYASMGGAFLRREPYYPHRLDSQLDEQARRFLQSPRGVVIDRNSATIQLSDIFIWYREVMIAKYGQIKKFRDRPDDIRSYLNCILLYLKPEDARILESISPAVKFMKYDWQLNEK